MQSPANRPRRHLLRTQVVLVATLSLLALVYEIWNAYGDYTWSKAQTPLIELMEKDQDGLLRLDQTMDAEVRIAALAVNPGAQAHYLKEKPQREALLIELLRLDPAPGHRGRDARILAALRVIAAAQGHAFELVRAGDVDGARSLLASAPLDVARATYAQGMAFLRDDVEHASDAVDAALLDDLFWNGISAVATALLLVFGSLFVFRITRRWQAAMMKSNQDLNAKSLELEVFNVQLNAKSHELEAFNHRLDLTVEERTKELSESAIASLNMMEDAVRQREDAEQTHRKLDYLAYYDPLTGLANRGLFLERVAHDMRNAASGGFKVAVVLIDLERFKNINDSLGQLAGDALLKQVAEWLARSVGDAGLVARVDSDHFAILLPDIRPDGDVARMLDRMIESFLAHPFQLNDAVFRIAAKGGVALFPGDGDDADVLFKYAEAALKQAKARGDRYLFYTQAMTAQAAGKPTLENQLRQAIDNDEFVLHYQPKVNLVSGLLVGAEALIRWNDPRTGLVPPFKFIPILEETGLIHEVGRWAMRKALGDYLRWRKAGLPAVRIAVNVSALQLRNRGFIDDVRQVIGIDAHAAAGLELEITESMVMEDVKQTAASLQVIRALGVTIAIDDFGTGFSSLGYLSKLPIDTLKIDRSFVVDMTAGPEGLALVSTIITLAHSLKLNVVAEGVETEEQSRLLRLLGSDEMQGYLFSKPVPGDIFESRFLQPAREPAVHAPQAVA